MSLIFGNYTALAMTPTEWRSLRAQGFTVEKIVTPPKVRVVKTGPRPSAAVVAATEEYRAILKNCPLRRDRLGKCKAIAQKYGIKQNSICTRLKRLSAR